MSSCAEYWQQKARAWWLELRNFCFSKYPSSVWFCSRQTRRRKPRLQRSCRWVGLACRWWTDCKKKSHSQLWVQLRPSGRWRWKTSGKCSTWNWPPGWRRSGEMKCTECTWMTSWRWVARTYAQRAVIKSHFALKQLTIGDSPAAVSLLLTHFRAGHQVWIDWHKCVLFDVLPLNCRRTWRRWRWRSPSWGRCVARIIPRCGCSTGSRTTTHISHSVCIGFRCWSFSACLVVYHVKLCHIFAATWKMNLKRSKETVSRFSRLTINWQMRTFPLCYIHHLFPHTLWSSLVPSHSLNSPWWGEKFLQRT